LRPYSFAHVDNVGFAVVSFKIHNTKGMTHMTKTDYNGWTNRETWVINLWLGEYFQDVSNDGQSLMADYIEETVWDMLEEAEVPPMFKDMIDLGVVNWQELAEHYVTDEEVA